MYAIDLRGQHGLVMGVANHRSLAWAIARQLDQAGARLCVTWASERLRPAVEELAASLHNAFTMQCDVTRDEMIDDVVQRIGSRWGSLELLVHGIAYARREDLEGDFVATPRAGFQLALEVSAYSLLNVLNRALPLLARNGASVVTLTYFASERAVPSYNVMGSAKAVLEQSVRQLAYELGPKHVRVNALSPGPVSTLAARGIHGFTDMLKEHARMAPLGRNITPDDVGKAALFLLSDLASGVTGETLYVDAGYHIMGW
jgi:enoyl-[acyl-carrier protein] reductase I